MQNGLWSPNVQTSALLLTGSVHTGQRPSSGLSYGSELLISDPSGSLGKQAPLSLSVLGVLAQVPVLGQGF